MKRSIIGALGVLLLLTIGFGFYRGWFVLSGHGPETGSGKVEVNLKVDPDKMKEDAERVKGKATEPVGE